MTYVHKCRAVLIEKKAYLAFVKREEVSELVLIVVTASCIAKIVATVIGFNIRCPCTTPLVDIGAKA